MALVDTSGLGPNGEPVTTTTQQVTPSTSHSASRAYVDPEARAKARQWFDQLDAEEAARKSGAPVAQPSAEDVAADVASQQRSQKVIDKAEAAAQPDPFDAPAGPVPTIGGKPIMAPEQM